jgi:hypothetical protein
MTDLVYTCNFGSYDWVLPPVSPPEGLVHVLVTDALGPKPRGWVSHVVNPADWGGPVAANRYWKMLGHRELPGYERTLYVDANIRLLGDSAAFLDLALPAGATMGLFRHPLRTTVAAEAQACLQVGKVDDAAAVERELGDYTRTGFADDQGLSENTIMARRSGAPRLDEAMQAWWDLYSRYASRDQLSLPVVRWQAGLPVHWIDWSFRDLNPWFSIYSHRKGIGVNPWYALVEARAHDSALHAALLGGWRTARAVRREIRWRAMRGSQ